jgi:hypothetical protein
MNTKEVIQPNIQGSVNWIDSEEATIHSFGGGVNGYHLPELRFDRIRDALLTYLCYA